MPINTDYGIAIDMKDDLPLRWRFARGRKNLANAIARRLTTPPGALAAISSDYGRDYGYDLRDLLNDDMGPTEVAAAQAAIAVACEQDDRVRSAQVTLTAQPAASSLTVQIDLVDADGPFSLVLSVDQLSTQVILENS